MRLLQPALLAATLALGATAASAHSTTFVGTFAPDVLGATGSGTLSLEYDDDGHTLLINATWAGLSGTTTNAHIHCCTTAANTGTAGVALAQASIGRLPDFPLGVSSGSYVKIIDLTQAGMYSATFVTASGGTAAQAEAHLISNLMSGNAYLNIHTTTFGAGEIRTFVTAVPEPETYALMLAGLGVVAWVGRRRRG
ncbi:FxDxF family PEP-CTERM protein [Roseateles sp.]|uniref:CHRD domain-containing protein n=1 Tax=Roseateles sp. TaxID=1971397 RepID=UPI003265B600